MSCIAYTEYTREVVAIRPHEGPYHIDTDSTSAPPAHAAARATGTPIARAPPVGAGVDAPVVIFASVPVPVPVAVEFAPVPVPVATPSPFTPPVGCANVCVTSPKAVPMRMVGDAPAGRGWAWKEAVEFCGGVVC